jgi:hypothetical protein
VNWSTDFQTVTLIKPGVIFKPLLPAGPARVTPGGFPAPVVTTAAVLSPVKAAALRA